MLWIIRWIIITQSEMIPVEFYTHLVSRPRSTATYKTQEAMTSSASWRPQRMMMSESCLDADDMTSFRGRCGTRSRQRTRALHCRQHRRYVVRRSAVEMTSRTNDTRAARDGRSLVTSIQCRHRIALRLPSALPTNHCSKSSSVHS